MGNVGFGEIVLIFMVALLVFGAKRLPEIARGLGQGIREFKDATSGIKREFDLNEDYTPRNQEPQRYISNPQPPFNQPISSPPESVPQSAPQDTNTSSSSN